MTCVYAPFVRLYTGNQRYGIHGELGWQVDASAWAMLGNPTLVMCLCIHWKRQVPSKQYRPRILLISHESIQSSIQQKTIYFSLVADFVLHLSYCKHFSLRFHSFPFDWQLFRPNYAWTNRKVTLGKLPGWIYPLFNFQSGTIHPLNRKFLQWRLPFNHWRHWILLVLERVKYMLSLRQSSKRYLRSRRGVW